MDAASTPAQIAALKTQLARFAEDFCTHLRTEEDHLQVRWWEWGVREGSDPGSLSAGLLRDRVHSTPYGSISGGALRLLLSVWLHATLPGLHAGGWTSADLT